MEYFAQFPNLLYTFDPNKIEFSLVKDIFARVKVLDSILNDTLVYYQYSMKDSDTVESIAHKYYGDAKRHWIILFTNRIIDPYFDLPLKTNDLNNNIILKYGSIENAQANIARVERRQTVTSTKAGTSNTQVYVTTATPYTYDFSLGQVQGQTFPTIGFPIVDLGEETVVLDDGTVTVTDTKLVAVNSYDYEQRLNEEKRKIKLIDKRYVSQIELQLQNLLKV